MKDEVLIRFRVVGDEARALQQWSAEQLRNPRQQLQWLLRKELKQQGRLSANESDEHEQGVQNV